MSLPSFCPTPAAAIAYHRAEALAVARRLRAKAPDYLDMHGRAAWWERHEELLRRHREAHSTLCRSAGGSSASDAHLPGSAPRSGSPALLAEVV